MRPSNPYEPDEETVEDEVSIPMDVEKDGEVTSLAKHVGDTLRPTARLVFKSLPDLPIFGTFSSRRSGSLYSNGSFQYHKVLNMFPDPPEDIPNVAHFDGWESSNSLPTSTDFVSFPNDSSGSIATTTLTPSPAEPFTLMGTPKPEATVFVRETPGPSRSDQAWGSRAHPQASAKGSIHTSIRITSTPPRKPSSGAPSRSPNRPEGRACTFEDFRNILKTPEAIAIGEQVRLEMERKEEERKRKEETQELIADMPYDFGLNLFYRGGAGYHDRFESDTPDKRDDRDRGLLVRVLAILRPRRYLRLWPNH